ncbi:uncharacterized protein LOC144709817 isoform X3 [Wolffia australiana]
MAMASLVPLVVVLFLSAGSPSPIESCATGDLQSLLEFKSSLRDSNAGVLSTWTGSDCCSKWYGVSCNAATGRVEGVNLHGAAADLGISEVSPAQRTISGEISPAICRLDMLSTFVLAYWRNISGSIPPCLTSLAKLRILDLVGNQIAGRIPPDLGRLSRLTVIALADNQISGQIPPSISKLAALMHLDLSNNRITGSIPASIGDLKMLSRALLGGNQISGSIPPSIGYMDRLSDLDLSGNRVSGQIPTTLGKTRVLSSLYLDGNSLSGFLPSTLLGSHVSILNLSRNLLEGQFFSGRNETRNVGTQTIFFFNGQIPGRNGLDGTIFLPSCPSSTSRTLHNYSWMDG